jgi:hypothetical protein
MPDPAEIVGRDVASARAWRGSANTSAAVAVIAIAAFRNELSMAIPGIELYPFGTSILSDYCGKGDVSRIEV